jgi:hypothetical protein
MSSFNMNKGINIIHIGIKQTIIIIASIGYTKIKILPIFTKYLILFLIVL